MIVLRHFVPLVLASALLAACSSRGPTHAPSTALPPATSAPAVAEDHLRLYQVSFDDLAGWRDDPIAQALPAMRRSCEHIVRLNPSQPVGNDGLAGVASDWFGPCGALRNITANDHEGARAFFEFWFLPFRASNGDRPDGLFTGYYEAELHGSRKASARYKVPLYARPADLPADPPSYFSRAEIEAGALKGKAMVLYYVDDAVDAHILHIQGSGRILLDDGTSVRVGYNGNNGHKFVGISRILLDHGKLQPGDTTMQAARVYLKAHPEEAAALMAENPRFVFFRQIEGDGPIGAAGVALTPGRSLAVDTHFVPLGLPLWLDTTDPAGQSMRRLMVAQDTGAAIKGPVRGDFFWGSGAAAFDKAGKMKSRGGYYLLLPRQRSGALAMALD